MDYESYHCPPLTVGRFVGDRIDERRDGDMQHGGVADSSTDTVTRSLEQWKLCR